MKRAILTLAITSLSFSAFSSDEKISVSKWKGTEAVTSSIKTVEGVKHEQKLFTAILNIDSINAGLDNANGSFPKVYLYFTGERHGAYTQPLDACNHSEFIANNGHYSVREKWNIGGTEIGMYTECYYSKQNLTWVAAGTPLTKDGEAYLYKLFKESSVPIGVKRNDHQWMEASASGFSKAWASRVAELTKIAEKGNSGAMFALGYGYFNVEKKDKKAFPWLLKAARAGVMVGQEWVGHMYLNGLGVAQDKPNAAYWFQKASEQGSEFAKKQLVELAK
ncbi:tetratricopeptide repeat protein [Vibrio hannami]|uniref:tetratricopeptide repeat protein n=1 Tax=Vibrio hannami TaxID=2717094 RepID=UPI00240ED113|nr:tetratricopeptide repeat protein [Vibrio hannami]MDG3087754.1 tetratricopeptide repeat protein [Vibrio hannami]